MVTRRDVLVRRVLDGVAGGVPPPREPGAAEVAVAVEHHERLAHGASLVRIGADHQDPRRSTLALMPPCARPICASVPGPDLDHCDAFAPAIGGRLDAPSVDLLESVLALRSACERREMGRFARHRVRRPFSRALCLPQTGVIQDTCRPRLSPPSGLLVNTYCLTHLSDGVLLRDLADLVTKDRRITAALLARSRRGGRAHALRASGISIFASLLRAGASPSEDAAAKRIQAARTARAIPALFDAVADGRLHLSGVCRVGPSPHAGERGGTDESSGRKEQGRDRETAGRPISDFGDDAVGGDACPSPMAIRATNMPRGMFAVLRTRL